MAKKHKTISLKKWPSIRQDTYKIFNSRANVYRMSHLSHQLGKGETIFEMGCGYGYLAGILIKYNLPKEYLGVDIDPKAIKSCNDMLAYNKFIGNYRFIQQDAANSRQLGFVPSSVLCVEVLEHVIDYSALLECFFSYVKNGSRGIVSVPRYNVMTKTPGHVNNFTNNFFFDMFNDLGFVIKETSNVLNIWNTYVIVSSEKTK